MKNLRLRNHLGKIESFSEEDDVPQFYTLAIVDLDDYALMRTYELIGIFDTLELAKLASDDWEGRGGWDEVTRDDGSLYCNRSPVPIEEMIIQHRITRVGFYTEGDV